MQGAFILLLIHKYTHNLAAAFRIALIVGEPPEHDTPNRGATGAVGRDAVLSSRELYMGTRIRTVKNKNPKLPFLVSFACANQHIHSQQGYHRSPWHPNGGLGSYRCNRCRGED
jgi:hypothetical protein